MVAGAMNQKIKFYNCRKEKVIAMFFLKNVIESISFQVFISWKNLYNTLLYMYTVGIYHLTPEDQLLETFW